jgi:hypothetical protein
MQENPLPTLLYRIDIIEKDITYIRTQLNAYEPSRENDLKLQRVNDTAARMVEELRTLKQVIEGFTTRIAAQDLDSRQRDQEIDTRARNADIATQKRDSDIESSQDKLQIKVLVAIISTIVTVIIGLLIYYITHQ